MTTCSFSATDIALHTSVGIADSLHNLQLVNEFCLQYLPDRLLHLTVNDLFHLPHEVKSNLLVFLAELFHTFEVVKPECVTGDGKNSTEFHSQNWNLCLVACSLLNII